MSPSDFDAVVVGAGPNGLIAALRIAMAGRRVLVLEAADRIGGAMRTEELTLPGFRHDVGATVLPLALASPAFRAVAGELAEVGWSHPEVPVAHPLGHDAVLVHRDVAATAAELGRDGAAWRALMRPVLSGGDRLLEALLSPLSARPAMRVLPWLAGYGVTGVLPARLLARLAFRDEPAKAMLAGMAGHSVLSLRQASTAGYAVFMAGLAHHVGWPLVTGGTENLARALGAALLRNGAEIHTSNPVTRLEELPSASKILLDLTPRQVLAVAGDRLPARYRAALGRYRYGPGVFKLDWALDAPVPWLDPRVGTAGTVHLGGSMTEIARSEAKVMAGGHPARPYVLCVQATVCDPSRSPDGKHTLWAYCHVPNGSTTDMTAAVEDQVERYAPGFRDRVLARHVMSPAALEQFDPNLVGGDVGGGSADLRQFVARPVLRARPWRTPVPGLYLASASTPPGGGVHGMGGWHAARLALEDR